MAQQMPAPPPVGLFTRYVLENPYPLGLVLLAIAVALAASGLRQGRVDRLRWSLLPLALAAGVLLAGLLVATSAERAKVATRRLVDAVVGEDLVGVMNCFADDALLHLGATTNIGMDVDAIRDGVSRFAGRFDVESNRISMLDGYTESSTRATVHLALWTDAGGYGPTPSQWVIAVERQDDGAWKIADLTFISVAGRAPPTSW